MITRVAFVLAGTALLRVRMLSELAWPRPVGVERALCDVVRALRCVRS